MSLRESVASNELGGQIVLASVHDEEILIFGDREILISGHEEHAGVLEGVRGHPGSQSGDQEGRYGREQGLMC